MKKALVATIILLAVFASSSAYTAEPAPELIVTIDDVGYVPSAPSEDSVIVDVFLENLYDAVAGIDVWIAITHNELVQFMNDSVYRCDTIYFNCEDSTCIEWVGEECVEWEYSNCQDTLINCGWVQLGAVRLEGSVLEDWDIVDVNVFGSQRMILQLYGLAITAPPIPAGGQHLLAKLAFEITDKTGHLIDSLCSYPDFYDECGTTEIWIQPSTRFSDETGSGLIGWFWEKSCVDSICTEWSGDTCLAWECTEWDSIYAPDTNALVYRHGSITLVCECDAMIGDADGSGVIDIDDVVYLVAYVFSGGPEPTPYAVASGDADCSGNVDVDDVVYIVEIIFLLGPPPCTCEEWVTQHGLLR